MNTLRNTLLIAAVSICGLCGARGSCGQSMQASAPGSAAKPTTGADHLSIGGNVPKPFTLSLDDLHKMPHKTIQVMDAHTNKQETFEGVPLSDLLKQAGLPQGEQIRGALMTTYVIAAGSDGYRALFSLAELDSAFEDSGVIVADRMEGAPITGDEGPLRLVVPNDKRPARWVRMLESITVGNVPKQVKTTQVQGHALLKTEMPSAKPSCGIIDASKEILNGSILRKSLKIQKKIRKKLLAGHRKLREFRMLAKGLLSTKHPLLVHIIPIRRCNLACTYCNEFDDFSKPVPLEEMFKRIDRLGEMGTAIITISGGEPLLHPELDAVISRIRKNGIMAGMITNGYLLTADRIEKLNRAGLEYLQISIDNAMPDEVSKKSLKVLDQKLKLLAEHAEFQVNINSVLGSGIKKPEDALAVAHRAVDLGFTSTVGILHDGNGQLQALGERERGIFEEIMALGKRSFTRVNSFQHNIAAGRENNWRCRAGSRYLYICEDGLVHYCSQQRGYPGIPLAQYTDEQRRREFFTKKGCAPRCTVSCVHQISTMDYWRAPQTIEPDAARPPESLAQITT